MVEHETSSLERYRDILVFAALAAIVTVIYLQTRSFDFINLDDGLYVVNNPYVLSGINLKTISWSLTTFQAANWHPVTWLSLALDVQLFGPNAGGLHMTNAALHLINSFLVYFVFRRMTGRFWASVIVAALFAAHPTHVESVAWIAERKDVLSTTFWLLTILTYVKCVESESISLSKYFPLLLVVFALGLMTKPMLVTLPFVLLLCDYWPLERVKTFDLKSVSLLFAEKIPLFLLTIGSSIITVIAQRSGGAIVTIEALPFATRIGNSLVSTAKYILMMFYPADLALWYPYDKNIPGWAVAGSLVLIAAISTVCIYQAKKRKYLIVGWLWFLGTLVPVIGLVQVGAQALADRYTYIPYLGLFIMVVWSLAELAETMKVNARVFRGAFAVVIAALTAMSFVQARYWSDSEVLFKRTLSLTSGNFLIQHNLCDQLMKMNRPDEAESYCRASLESKPDYFEAYNTLGTLAVSRARFDEAEADFSQTVRLAPGYALAYANLATAQLHTGKLDEAEANLQRAAGMSAGVNDPAVFSRGLADLAVAFEKQGNYQKAADNFSRVTSLIPESPSAHARLAAMLVKLNKMPEAQQHVDKALSLDAKNAVALNAAGLILLSRNDRTGAAAKFEAALQSNPDLEEAKQSLQKLKGAK